MHGQGERDAAPDWWSRLYDEGASDAGGAEVPGGESVDERFDSAARTVAGPPPVPPAPDPEPAPAPAPPAPELPVAPPPGTAAAPPAPEPRRGRGYIGDRPPTYAGEPSALPPADPERLGELTPDTVLDGARHGPLTVRAVSTRGDSARYRGQPRHDALLTARFGSGDGALLLLAVATGARAAEAGHLAAHEACEWIGGAIGRAHARLVEDLRRERRVALKAGLGRLTARSLGRLRASAAEQGLDPADYTAGLRCLLLPADPHCRVRLFFGVGEGGLFRLRAGEWQDLEPGGGVPKPAGEARTLPELPAGFEEAGEDRLAGAPPFLFRTSLAEPGDALLLCSSGLAQPVREEPEFSGLLAERWGGQDGPPGLVDFLADTRVRAKGYADDRTAVGVWEPGPARD